MADRREVMFKAIDISGRTPRYDEELERGLASEVLTRGGAITEVRAAGATAGDFYVGICREVMRVALELDAGGEKVDFHAIASRLKDQNRLQACGGYSELLALVNTTPAIASAEGHARAIVAIAEQRRLGDAASILAAEAATWRGPPLEFVQRVRQVVDLHVDKVERVESESIGDVTERRMREIVHQWRGQRDAFGMRVGLQEYDSITRGLRHGQLHVVAALTGGGKSVFALQTALALAGTVYNGERIGCVYVSGEMPSGELVDRAICQLAGVTDDELQSGQRHLPIDGEDPIARAEKMLHVLPIEISRGRMSFESIRALVRRTQRRFDMLPRPPGEPPTRVQLVIVDYLQIMRFSRADRLQRHDQAIGDFTSALKDLAMDERLHVMLLSQFNREGAKRSGVPLRSDLKESGSIENDSDLITFVHRPYIAVAEEDRDDDLIDHARLILAKARGREEGRGANVAFDGKFFRFVEPSDEQISRWREAHRRLRDNEAPVKRKRARDPYAPRASAPKPPPFPSQSQ